MKTHTASDLCSCFFLEQLHLEIKPNHPTNKKRLFSMVKLDVQEEGPRGEFLIQKRQRRI